MLWLSGRLNRRASVCEVLSEKVGVGRVVSLYILEYTKYQELFEVVYSF